MDKRVSARVNAAVTNSVRPTEIATSTRSASHPRRSSKTSSFARKLENDAEYSWSQKTLQETAVLAYVMQVYWAKYLQKKIWTPCNLVEKYKCLQWSETAALSQQLFVCPFFSPSVFTLNDCCHGFFLARFDSVMLFPIWVENNNSLSSSSLTYFQPC